MPRRIEGRKKILGDGGGWKLQCEARNSVLAQMSSYNAKKIASHTLKLVSQNSLYRRTGRWEKYSSDHTFLKKFLWFYNLESWQSFCAS